MAVVSSTDAKQQQQNDDEYQHFRSSFLLKSAEALALAQYQPGIF
jgi:hypothetical protein